MYNQMQKKRKPMDGQFYTQWALLNLEELGFLHPFFFT